MIIAFLLIALALLALWPASLVLPAAITPRAGVGLCAAALALALAGLALGRAQAGTWAGLDGLSLWFAAAVLLGVAPAILMDAPRAAPIAGAMLLLVLASDAVPFVLVLAALWLLLQRERGLAGWAACCAIAMLVLALRAGTGFAAMRLEPPEGALASLAFVLVLGGLGAQWFGLLRGAGGPALAAAGALGVAVATRLTLDLLGPAPPVWWGLALTAGGLIGAVLGGWRAAIADGMDEVAAGSAVGAAGLACAGLGVAVAARGADLLPLAGLGLEAALLQVLAAAVSVGTLALCAESVRVAAGGAELAGLGGLGRRMPLTGAAVLVAVVGLAGLPPSAGFASLYLLLQALFSASRISGIWLPFGATCAVAATGLAAGLTALAGLRLIGLGFLGAPRSPAADTAREPHRDMRIGLAGFGALGALLAIGAGPLLLLVRPMLPVASDLGVAAALAPVAVALLLGIAGGAAWAVRRGLQATRGPAWEGGLPAQPVLAPYVPARLMPQIRLFRPRPPSLREWIGATAVLLLLILIVLLAR